MLEVGDLQTLYHLGVLVSLLAWESEGMPGLAQGQGARAKKRQIGVEAKRKRDVYMLFIFEYAQECSLLQDSCILDSVQMQNEKIVFAPHTRISFIVSFTGIDFPLTMGGM